MAGASGKRETITETRTGFAASEVQQFLSQGNLQSAGSFGDIAAPTLKTQSREVIKDMPDMLNSLSRRTNTTTLPFQGFMGAFSDITEDEVAFMSRAFSRREKEIRQRVAQPGRSQLMGTEV
jgi:hypothetical protein